MFYHPHLFNSLYSYQFDGTITTLIQSYWDQAKEYPLWSLSLIFKIDFACWEIFRHRGLRWLMFWPKLKCCSWFFLNHANIIMNACCMISLTMGGMVDLALFSVKIGLPTNQCGIQSITLLYSYTTIHDVLYMCTIIWPYKLNRSNIYACHKLDDT